MLLSVSFSIFTYYHIRVKQWHNRKNIFSYIILLDSLSNFQSLYSFASRSQHAGIAFFFNCTPCDVWHYKVLKVSQLDIVGELHNTNTNLSHFIHSIKEIILLSVMTCFVIEWQSIIFLLCLWFLSSTCACMYDIHGKEKCGNCEKCVFSVHFYVQWNCTWGIL